MTASPRPQRTAGLIAASRRKAEAAENAARAAITKLRRAGTSITIAAIAREAGVSQHYLHQHPDLGPLIRSMRDAATPGVKLPPVDSSQSGIVSVLRARIEGQVQERQALLDRIAKLEEELERLRGALIRQ